MINLGTFRPGSTIYAPFHTFNSSGASVTITGLLASDIEIYKDGGVTQRASDSGYTLLDTDGIDFDSVTGIHGVSIDLADNTTAGFYAAGSKYFVVIASITVDSQTVNFIPVMFEIGYPDAVINTTIATLSSQTSFTLTSGPAEDDALNGCVVCIHDVASAVQLGFGYVSDYTGASKTVTLAAGVSFTAAATDNIAIFRPVQIFGFGGVAGTFSGGRPEVNTTHAAGTAWGSGAITAASIATDAIDADAIADNAINAGAIATGAITAAKFAAGAIDAAAIADGAIDAATFAAGAITATVIATDAIDADALADGAITAATFAADAITATVIAANAIGASELATDAVNEIVDQVWREAIADHSGTAGSTAEALAAAGSAGDPWATALPGAYGAGTAGRLIGRSCPDITAGSAGGLFIAGSNAATTVATFTCTGAFTTGAIACTTITASGAVAFQSTFAVTGATTFTGAITGTNASNSLLLGATQNAATADGFLDRDMATGTDSGSTTVRTPRQALRFLRNKWSISGTTLTVTKENDSTASWTSEVTTNASADPITANDPAGP